MSTIYTAGGQNIFNLKMPTIIVADGQNDFNLKYTIYPLYILQTAKTSSI